MSSSYFREMRLRLTIAYDGAPFKGWAKQPDVPTVQETIENALQQVAQCPVKILGSGRTDAGVHADGQVAHFDIPEGNTMNPYNWLPAMNSKLPPTIRIVDCTEVAADFHARFSATSKTYVYSVDTSPVLHPHNHGRVWHLPRQLDPVTLQDCLDMYLGERDFRHFSALRGNETEDTSYVRNLQKASVSETPTGFQITYTANGFLYKMVRILTGVAMQVAQARLLMSIFQDMVAGSGDEFNTSKFCAPAAGLRLKEVHY